MHRSIIPHRPRERAVGTSPGWHTGRHQDYAREFARRSSRASPPVLACVDPESNPHVQYRDRSRLLVHQRPRNGIGGEQAFEKKAHSYVSTRRRWARRFGLRVDEVRQRVGSTLRTLRLTK